MFNFWIHIESGSTTKDGSDTNILLLFYRKQYFNNYDWNYKIFLIILYSLLKIQGQSSLYLVAKLV